jgi:arylsulfatase A-like enzyme
MVMAFIFTGLLTVKSLVDFTMSGPTIQKEITDNFFDYGIYAVARLACWVFLLSCYLASIGVFIYFCIISACNWRYRWLLALLSGIVSFVVIVLLQFFKHLLYSPSSIISSSLYRNNRLYPLWEQLSPTLLNLGQLLLLSALMVIIIFCLLKLIHHKRWQPLSYMSLNLAFFYPLFLSIGIQPNFEAIKAPIQTHEKPNIIMIGSDTLRADRLGAFGYKRNLTPNIDTLAKEGVQFSNFFVPIARTAPSLTSFLTGTWPHTHKIRDNYNSDEKVNLPVKTLPNILAESGYYSEAITDWAGADLGKIKFGFNKFSGPDDQWNLKYLMRQGPKDIRLFLTLFTQNEFGKTFLPELYYLAGIPLTKELEAYTKQRISSLASLNQPFFLTLFTSTTHIPFGCEYPYYSLYTDPTYLGESKFLMSGLSTPSEIINKQGQSKEAFDLKQIIDLYDGCVHDFDDTVGELVNHIKKIGLDKNTIIIIFSDHGIDLFEKQAWGQGNSVLGNDPSARVPLIIVHPFLPKNKRIVHTSRSIDLVPTLLDLIAITKPDTVEGVSLLPYLDTNNEQNNLNLEAYFETGVWLTPLAVLNRDHLKYPSALELLEVPNKETGTLAIKPQYINIDIEARDRMIRTDKWKLVYLPMKDGALYWLFDNINDPNGEIDVSKKYPQAFAEMKQRLINWLKKDNLRTWKNEHLVAAANP